MWVRRDRQRGRVSEKNAKKNKEKTNINLVKENC